MKKYFLTIIIFILLINFLKFDKSIETFQYSNNYNIYLIEVNNKKISEIKNIFNDININDYLIISYSIANNYNEYIKKDINSINIKQDSFIKSFNDYLNNYNKILFKYNLDSEIGKAPIIEKITIKTTYDIYENLLYKLK